MLFFSCLRISEQVELHLAYQPVLLLLLKVNEMKKEVFIQVPDEFTRNLCRYKNETRFYYSAMVNALDDAVDKVNNEHFSYYIQN